MFDYLEEEEQEKVDPVELFEAIAKQENQLLKNVIYFFIRRIDEQTFYPIEFYHYEPAYGFNHLQEKHQIQKCCEFLKLLAEGFKRETYPVGLNEESWVLRNIDNKPYLDSFSTDTQFTQFYFKLSSICLFLKHNKIAIPDYLQSGYKKVSYVSIPLYPSLEAFVKDLRIKEQADKKQWSELDAIEEPELNPEQLKEELYRLKKENEALTAKNTQLKAQQPILLRQCWDKDLLSIAITVRNQDWKNYDPETGSGRERIKKENIISELKEKYHLTDNQAKSIELVACPIDRNPAKSF